MAQRKAVDITQTVIHYDDEPAQPPPTLEVGLPAWLRKNLFGSPSDIAITIVSALVALALLFGFFNWAISSANWFAIINNQRLFMLESFERAFEWRVAITVLLSALLTGVSIAAWGRKSVRMLTIISAATLLLIALLPPVIESAIPQPNSYLTAGNVDIIDRASTITPQRNLGFIAAEGETVSLRLATDEVADIHTLSDLAGFSDRASNALANAARNRLEQQDETGAVFDRMISGEMTEALEERTRLVIRTFWRTNDMQASTRDYLLHLDAWLTGPEATLGEVKVWMKRLEDAVKALDDPEDQIIAALEALEDSSDNLTADDAMSSEIRGAIEALTASALESEQLEALGEQLVLDLTEDLIGEPDQPDDDEDLIQPSAWEASFLRDMFTRLLTPQSVLDIYDLGQTPLHVAIRDGETFEPLVEGVVDAGGGAVTAVIPRDGWYVLTKDAAQGSEGSGILVARGIFPVVERTLSATLSQFARLTDNELEIFGNRPRLEGKVLPIVALIDNQFRGLRDLSTFLVHFIPLFLEQLEAVLLPFFLTVAWGYALGRAFAHVLGENSVFNSRDNRVIVLLAANAPFLVLLAYFGLVDGDAVTGWLATIAKVAAVLGAVALAWRIETWLNRANSGEDAEASINRLLLYGWGIYPVAMFTLVSGIGGLSGATLGSIAGGIVWLVLMRLAGMNARGNLRYVFLVGGLFLQIAQAHIVNMAWNGWSGDDPAAILIWLGLAVVGVGAGLVGKARAEALPFRVKSYAYLFCCLAFLFIFADTNLLSDGAASGLLALAILLWLGWMLFSGTLRWTTSQIVIGLLLLTFLWMQSWTGVDRWSILYFCIWLAIGAFAFMRGERAQADASKSTMGFLNNRFIESHPLPSMGALGLLWLALLLIVPAFVQGLESADILRTSAHDLLPLSDKRLWGGLMLTMQLTILGIGASFPLGLALALGRRSRLPAVRYACVTYIEVVRGVPLITVLFLATLLVPLVDPTLATIEGAVRAWFGITLFSAAYLAENVRGGLQSLAPGQTEAAQAIGLSAWQTTLYIQLPQALRAVIPALVGQFISLFKDTSLVSIIGLADLTGIASRIVAQPEFLQKRQETYLYAAIIYFVFSYIMSYISRRVEATGSGASRAQEL